MGKGMPDHHLKTPSFKTKIIAQSGKGDLLTPPPHNIRLRKDAMAGQAPRAGPQGAVHEDYRAVAG